MELVIYPDPILRKRAAPIPAIDDAVRERAREMFEIKYRERGVGLAAPQVGWSARLFVLNPTGDPEHPEGERVFVNPGLLRVEGEILDEEGCLSIPEVRGRVLRSEKVVLRAQGLDGLTFEAELDGIGARAVQHEIDHLDGILFISRLGPTDRLRVGGQLKKLEREYKRKAMLRSGR